MILTSYHVTFPIQLAAFLMTLVRKNIISAKIYHLIYGCSLASGYVITMKNLYSAIITGFVLYWLRTKIGLNKYLMWYILFSIYYFNSYPIYLFIGFMICLIFKNKIFDKSDRSESNTRVITNEVIFKNHHLINIKSPTKIDFKPGQYINLYYNMIKRPYTPINFNNELNQMEFLIKSYPDGEVSSKITSSYIPVK